jgi:hypothetical protein
MTERNGPPHTSPAKSKRPHGTHRFFVASPKAGRRLELWGIKQLNRWIELEADPDIQALCERPLVIEDGARTRCVDFWVTGSKGSSYLLLGKSAGAKQAEPARQTFPAFAKWAAEHGCTVEEEIPLPVTEERQRWYSNWTSILQEIGGFRGQLPASLVDGVWAYVREPIGLNDLFAQFPQQSPDLVRVAAYQLVYTGKLKFCDLGSALLSDDSQVAPR